MKLLALAGLGLALAGGVAAASSQADPVTLSMRQYTNSSKWRVLVWYGQVANGAAGEDVEVLGQAASRRASASTPRTKTVPGGGYEAESVSPQIPYQIRRRSTPERRSGRAGETSSATRSSTRLRYSASTR